MKKWLEIKQDEDIYKPEPPAAAELTNEEKERKRLLNNSIRFQEKMLNDTHQESLQQSVHKFMNMFNDTFGEGGK